MRQRFDVAVIGAGIVGLAHAWAAARRGRSVVVLERHARAQGASVRNFGMVWPIGQPAGPMLDQALLSRRYWLELAESADIWLNRCGSLHLAYENDELAVLQEFASLDTGHECELLSPQQTTKRYPAVLPTGLKGALYSPMECCVDPRQVIAQMPGFLHERYGVTFEFGTAAMAVQAPRVETARGTEIEADLVLVCSGADFETLFPEILQNAGIRRCKLQMMRTAPQPGRWLLGPHIVGGLTLCHYSAFSDCPTLPTLRGRYEAEFADYLRFGIHVMASQNELGEVVIGDSHEYDDDIEIFDKSKIDELILAYLRRLVRLPDWSIATRWHGIYAKHPTMPIFRATPQAGVEIMVAPGGAGMTLSFGQAEQWWAEGK